MHKKKLQENTHLQEAFAILFFCVLCVHPEGGGKEGNYAASGVDRGLPDRPRRRSTDVTHSLPIATQLWHGSSWSVRLQACFRRAQSVQALHRSGILTAFGFATEADADAVFFRGRSLRVVAFCTPTSCVRIFASCLFRRASARLLRRAALRISTRLVLKLIERFVRRSMVPMSSMICFHWSGITVATAAAFVWSLEVAVVANCKRGASAGAADAVAVSSSLSVSTSLVR